MKNKGIYEFSQVWTVFTCNLWRCSFVKCLPVYTWRFFFIFFLSKLWPPLHTMSWIIIILLNYIKESIAFLYISSEFTKRVFDLSRQSIKNIQCKFIFCVVKYCNFFETNLCFFENRNKFLKKNGLFFLSRDR